ncbi:MAG TPA: hypothetical protein VF868_05915 [Bacteroidia bacterium]|jgi:hypothetical protein
MCRSIAVAVFVISTFGLTAQDEPRGLYVNDSAGPGCYSLMISKDLLGLRSDEYTIIKCELVHHCLKFVISYSGGCGPAELKMYADTSSLQEPVIHLEPHFTDNDNCRSIIEEEAYFDLAPLMKRKKKPYAFQIATSHKVLVK